MSAMKTQALILQTAEVGLRAFVPFVMGREKRRLLRLWKLDFRCGVAGVQRRRRRRFVRLVITSRRLAKVTLIFLRAPRLGQAGELSVEADPAPAIRANREPCRRAGGPVGRASRGPRGSGLRRNWGRSAWLGGPIRSNREAGAGAA